MTTCGWLWIYAGILLMLLELVLPGFILCFFGLAAATVGALRFLLGTGFHATWQLAAFSLCSVLYIVLLRRWLKRTFCGERQITATDFDHAQIGRVGRVTQAIIPPSAGRVMVGDSEWAASADVALECGVEVRVTAQENLTLHVEALR